MTKKAGDIVLSAVALLTLGYGYVSICNPTPTPDVEVAGKDLTKLVQQFYTCNTRICSEGKKPSDLVTARTKAINQAGCKDGSYWLVRDLTATGGNAVYELTTSLKDCPGVHSNWTLTPEGKLVPFGPMVVYKLKEGEYSASQQPITCRKV